MLNRFLSSGYKAVGRAISET